MSYSISQLGRAFGLSRSTLLYYDRIGLLRAAARSDAGYRRYSQEEYARLERICMLRSTGLALADIKKMLDSEAAPSAALLEKRLQELGDQILQLRHQQHLITALLKEMSHQGFAPVVNKRMWVEMLRAAGMDEAGMKAWHAEFESRAPEVHFEFLLSLGIDESEARRIQAWSLEEGLAESGGDPEPQ